MHDAVFWGKLKKDDHGGVALLPLECHLADVGAVFEALCRSSVVRERLGKAQGRKVEAADIARLSCLAALHDLGKLTAGFQAKADGSGPSHGHIHPLPGLLTETGLRRLLDWLPWLPDWGENGGEAAIRLLVAAFSHHGCPLDMKGGLQRIKLWPSDPVSPHWKFGKALGNWLRAWFPAAFAPDAPPLPNFPALEHLFAGLVMLADWLGSDTRFFPVEGRAGGAGCMEDSRPRAALAVDAVGWMTEAWRPSVPPDFEAQFGFAPNALQRAVDAVALDPAGGMAVIEAETGFGKTEAALRYFSRLLAAGLVDGLYFANPLRFAATQLFGRVGAFAGRGLGHGTPATVLAVPGYLRADDATGQRLPDYSVLWDDDPGAAEAQRRWASEHPKRYLAAPLAVGTIDQALLAGLRTPHAHMRAACLSRSLLVIDEVHASDPYMTALTLGVLDLFRRVGGQVLLLSATLGGETRARYLRAMGAKVPIPDLAACEAAPYPCIATTAGVTPVPDERGDAERKPPVRCRLLSVQDDPGAVADLVARAAERGGRILMLRNAVSDVVETLRALEAPECGLPAGTLFSVNGVVCPHHARYARPDRETLDRAVEAAFGRLGACESGVLTATQTLEQSLDVDFDLLVTDLCPMDVLLQRLGRLHRHRARDARRPPGLGDPVCLVLTPGAMTPEALLGGQARRHQYGKERAYDNLPVLMATWERLADMDGRDEPLRIPAMSRSLVERALHSEALEAVAGRHGMQADWVTALGVAGARGTQGHMASVRWGEPFSEQLWAREAPREKTRLGTADLSVDFPEPFRSPFGNRVERLTIPEFLLPRGDIEGPPGILSATGEEIMFRLGGSAYTYSRFGLAKEQDS